MLLACPKCYSDSSLATIEQLYGVANCIVTDDEDVAWDGYTDIAWDSSETVGITCNDCDWSYNGSDWKEKLLVKQSTLLP